MYLSISTLGDCIRFPASQTEIMPSSARSRTSYQSGETRSTPRATWWRPLTTWWWRASPPQGGAGMVTTAQAPPIGECPRTAAGAASPPVWTGTPGGSPWTTPTTGGSPSTWTGRRSSHWPRLSGRALLRFAGVGTDLQYLHQIRSHHVSYFKILAQYVGQWGHHAQE